jgi:phosphoglycerate kinase
MAVSQIIPVADFGTLRGKTVLLRVDLNSPIEGGKVQSGPRFTAHAETVKMLSAKGCKLVVLAHQGRKGDKDFTSLKSHAAILSKLVEKKVLFAEDKAVVGEKTLKAVAALKAGEIMLLDNVRYLADEAVEKTPEQHAKESALVKALAPLADLFVDDAFSNAHRGHASMVGFCAVLPSAAGPVMEHEFEGALKARENAKHPNVYLLGGAKPDEVIKLMDYALKKGIVDKILTSGIIGELCLMARGNKLPQAKIAELEKSGFTGKLTFTAALQQVRELIHAYNEFIETPFDFAVADENGNRKEMLLTQLVVANLPSGDIGIKTSNKYSKIVLKSATVYVKGPCGKYEEKPFENGTRQVFDAVARSGAYTLVGGGHTLLAFEKFGIPTDKISHISLAGGALLELMQGKELPAITALESAAKKFKNTMAKK